MTVPVPSKNEIIARAMARHGRNGDTSMVHAAPGEIVIPNQVAADNPDLAIEALRAIRRSGGNPSRYIVGSDAGSYNPATGRQEFFWDKLLQVVAPAAVGTYLPDVGNIGMALTSAATSKLTGGSWEEALASGLGSFAAGYLADSQFGSDSTLGGAVDDLTGSSTIPGSEQNLYDSNPDYDMSGFYGSPESRSPSSPSSGWMGSLGNVSTRGVAAGFGGLAGQALYDAYKDFTKAPDLAPLSLPSYASLASQKGAQATLPMPVNNKVPTTAAPTPNTVTPLPADSGYGLPTGVSFSTEVKDRNTGRSRYLGIDEEEEKNRRQRDRALSWGATLTM